jgi:nucleoside-diphosphate-sugar epimerase
MKVLLTGFSGFLGRPVAEALRRQGASLRVILNRRTISRREYAGMPGVEVIWGRFDQPAVVEEALKGIEVVVHSGWAFSRQSDSRPTANESGTQLLFQASVKGGVRKFIFVSSVAVYGMGRSGETAIQEESPLAAGTQAAFIYPSEKAGLEQWLRGQDRREMALVIYRPGPIFDERKGPAKKVIKLAGCRLGLNFGGGNNRMAYIHVEDCADAIARGVTQAGDASVFNIVPSRHLRFREWIRAWGRRQGLVVRPFFVPTPVLRMAGWGANRLKRMLGRPADTDVRYVIAAATRDMTYSNEKLRTTLGWTDRRTEEYWRLI